MANDEEWIAAMKAKGHTPRMEDCGGKPVLDIFFLDAGFHNGPGCETCHWSCCHHCCGIEDIPECTEPMLELTAVEISGALPKPTE